MKALAYEQPHSLDSFAIEEWDVAEPTLRDPDVLVEIRAVGVNPGEALIRSVRGPGPEGRVILGWEFAGVVVQVGPVARGFAIGDRVMGTGDMGRDGCWAERVAVDHRVVARIPHDLSFTDAASLPIGGATAWEALFRDGGSLPLGVNRVLVIGGAGGVGSMAIQLLKAKTGATVIATASRHESRDWCERMGADLVVDHTRDVAADLAGAGVDDVDMVLSTAGTAGYLQWIAELLRPFGHLAAIDISPPFDVSPLVSKSISLHTEMVFAKAANGFRPTGQGDLLTEIAGLVAAGSVLPIVTTQLDGLTAENTKTAHEMIEARRSIGKIVIAA